MRILTVTVLTTASVLSAAAAESVIVIESFHARQPFVASRIAALWLLFGSAGLTLLALVLAFVLSAFQATHHLSRWAMLAVKIFGILTVVALVIGVTLTAVVILKEACLNARPHPNSQLI